MNIYTEICIYTGKERERESKTWIEGYRASKNNNFPTSFGRGLLQGNFLKFWVWQKLHDVKYCFWLSPNGTSVFSFWIQKFSLITNISRSVSLEPCKFTSLSMMMNLACLLKSCLLSWKCLQARMELGFLVSFLWLFNLRLNAVSAFPTYFILHNMQSIR